MKIYKVGGAVRDRLLGLPRQDTDWVVVGSTPEEMMRLGYKPIGSSFPVFLHPQTSEEYALARTERKTGHGYTGFTFHASPDVTLEDDLRRRDLTVNAMAEDESGRIIDPYGGRRDLEQRVLRHVSPAFTEDPLRVLRVARLAARLQFTIAQETLELLRRMTASGELQYLVPERVWSETETALSGPRAAAYFEILRECGALAVVFPELDALFGVPQPEKHHPEIDSGVHTFMVLSQACRLSDDIVVRFAALVHDLGKGNTPRSEWPQHIGHEERGVTIVNALCDRLRIPNRCRELAVLATRHHLDCHRVTELRPATLVRKLEELDAFRRPGRFEQFLLACEADARGRTGREDGDYPQAGYFRRVFECARAIPVEDIAATVSGGEAIGAEIRKRRIAAVTSLIGIAGEAET